MMVLPLCEIVPKTEYFDYVAKYKGKSEEIIPARINGEAEILVKSTAAMLYDKLNCSGVVRFDFILSKAGLYFLEVNTVPGMSEASIIPQMVRKNDMSVQDFFTQLIEEGIRKAKAARKK
jgi:D-alanine-D-alanine ligase